MPTALRGIALYGTLVALGFMATSALWLGRGLPIFGDWVPPASTYLHHISSVWNPYERNGSVNVDLRLLPLFAPLSATSGAPDGALFRWIDVSFITVCICLPALVAAFVARRWLGWGIAKSLLAGAFYGFNPWVPSQVGAGHVGILIGYALLPLACVVASSSRRRSYFLGGGAVLAGCLIADAHAALFSGAILVVGRLLRRGAWRGAVVEVALLGGVTALLSAFWLVPALVALWHSPYSPVSVGENVATQATLAQMANPVHVFSARSNWWVPFADGLFDYGPATRVMAVLLLALPCALVLELALVGRLFRRRIALAGIVLIGVGTVPQIVAHYMPATYVQLTGLPLGSVLRDVADQTPLYLLGLAFLCAAMRRWSWRITAAAMCTTLASLVPWVGGDLRGAIHPVVVDRGELNAIAWVDAHARTSDRVMWLPLDLYVQFPWSTFPLNDPVRFWSSTKALNSLIDATYDFSPGVTAALVNLQQSYLPAETSPGALAQVLAHEGVRYVVARTEVRSADITREIDAALAAAQGISLVGKFGAVHVYEVELSGRAEARLTSPVLFDGSWASLASATVVDPQLSRSYVPVSSLGPRTRNLARAPAFLAGGMWNAVFGMGAAAPPGPVVGREEVPFDPGLGYGYVPGETVTVYSRGVTAFRVLGSSDGFLLACAGGPAQNPDVAPTPDNLPRWVAVVCDGTVQLTVRRPLFVQAMTTFDRQEMYHRLIAVQDALGRAGSAYTFQASHLVAVESSVSGVRIATRVEDPLVLASGDYDVHVRCGGECGRGVVSLFPYGTDAWTIGRLGLSATQARRLTGIIVQAPFAGTGSHVVIHVAVAPGAYQVVLDGGPATSIDVVSVQRGEQTTATSVGQGTISQWGRNAERGAVAVSLNQAPGPWTARDSEGHALPLVPADLLGTAYFPDGKPSEITMGGLAQVEVWGFAVSGLAWCAVAALLPWARRLRITKGRTNA